MPQWKLGQSGNPAGRPKGSRDQITKAFVDALTEDFRQHGHATIERLREKDEKAYLQLVAHLVPKEASIAVNHKDATGLAMLEAMKAIAARHSAKIIDGDAQEVGKAPALPKAEDSG